MRTTAILIKVGLAIIFIIAIALFIAHERSDYLLESRNSRLKARYYRYYKLAQAYTSDIAYYESENFRNKYPGSKNATAIKKLLKKSIRLKARYRTKAEKIFLRICRTAETPDEFLWIFQNRGSADPKKIIDAVYLNRAFLANADWNNYAEEVLNSGEKIK